MNIIIAFIYLFIFTISGQPSISQHENGVSLPGSDEGNLVVEISDRDLQRMGPWPLERRWYALAIENLIEQGADSVFVNISFPKADVLRPESDLYFYNTILQNENVFIQYENTIPASLDSIIILDNRKFPADRTIAPFSDSFIITEDIIRLQNIPKNSLTKHLLSQPPPAGKSAVRRPDNLSYENLSLLESIRLDSALNRTNVLIFLNHAGITSYYAAPNNSSFPIPLLEWWTIHQMKSNNYLKLFPNIVNIVTALTLPVLVILYIIIQSTSLTRLIAYLFGLSVISLIVLFMINYYIPDYVAWSAFVSIMGLSGFLIVEKWKSGLYDNKDQSQNDTSEETLRELEKLRYRVGFFEKVKTSANTIQPEKFGKSGIICHEDSPLVPLLQKAAEIAKTDIPVLLTGESGSGKEEIAKFIHRTSPRSDNSFIAINCGSFNENLIESELFGFEKGSFTGAEKTKKGRFELADKGSLFLDEIAETGQAFQIKLLRVLQEGVFERVGGTESIKTSVRIISATHQDLQKLVNNNRFREDLYYRLNGFSLYLPPLRERKMDIPVLFEHFLKLEEKPKKYSESLIEWLKEQSWNGNIRELKSSIRRAVVNAGLKGREILLPEDFEIQNPTVASTDTTAETILSLIKEWSFNYKFISIIADKTNLHRVTVTEYVRGWIIHYLNKNPDSDAVARKLVDMNSINDSEYSKFKKRIDNYIDNILTKIKLGIRQRKSINEIIDTYFSQLPGYFREDLSELISKMGHNVLR